jgi:hypothetical protein
VAVTGTAKPRNPREYHQLRDEIACGFAAWLRQGGAIPSDGKLEGEIVATKAFDAGNGRRRVISNDELKKILKRSPDRRNACELAVWEPMSMRLSEEQHEAPPAPVAMAPARVREEEDFFSSGGDALSPYGGTIDPYGGAA